MTGARAPGRDTVLLFTASQVEEVLREVEPWPVPFTADWFLGLCAWRQQVLPVVDAARLYGIQALSAAVDDRSLYFVVRTVAPAAQASEHSGRGATEMLRCVLRLPDRIETGAIPQQCFPAAAELIGIDPSLTRGIFKHEGGLIIVPDLVRVVCPGAPV